MAAVFLNNTIDIFVCSQGAPGFVISTMVYYKNKQAFHPKTNFKLISLNAIQRKNVCIKILGAKLTKKNCFKGPAIKKFMPFAAFIGEHEIPRNFWIW